MAENLGKWPPKRGPVTKIRPSDGCGRDAVPLAVERRNDFSRFWMSSGECRIRPLRLEFDRPVKVEFRRAAIRPLCRCPYDRQRIQIDGAQRWRRESCVRTLEGSRRKRRE